MAEELIRTRCRQGTLIITDKQIIIELGQLHSQRLSRASCTSVESKVAIPSLFGRGGGTNLIFHGMGGEKLEASLVPPKEAERIVEILS